MNKNIKQNDVFIKTDTNDTTKWLFNNTNQLPTFEYYLQNCVIDKGGKYDFTKRNYGNMMDVKELKIKNSIIDRTKKVTLITKHSMWIKSNSLYLY